MSKTYFERVIKGNYTNSEMVYRFKKCNVIFYEMGGRDTEN